MKEYALIKNGEVVQTGELPINFENITRFDLADEKTIRAKGFLPVNRVSVEPQGGYKIVEDISVGENAVIITECLEPLTGDELTAYQAALPKPPTYKELRAREYPDFRDYLDGIVKSDTAQVQAYIDACLAVKLKYPKLTIN